MKQETKDRIAVNLALLPKKATSWVTTVVGGALTVWALLPDAQKQSLLEHSPLPVWAYPIAFIVIAYVASVWPQAPTAPAAVQAKLDEKVEKREDALAAHTLPVDPR